MNKCSILLIRKESIFHLIGKAAKLIIHWLQQDEETAICYSNSCETFSDNPIAP